MPKQEGNRLRLRLRLRLRAGAGAGAKIAAIGSRKKRLGSSE